MKKSILFATILLAWALATHAQTDTMYVMKAGVVVKKYNIHTQIDSLTFYDPTITVTDYDGNIYKTVTIGSQVWMAENLKTTHYADGTAIPLANKFYKWIDLTTTSKAYCWYDDDIANKAIYGALYTWAAAMNGAASSATNPSVIQGVCPTGWHLPSSLEWMQLIDYLGGERVAGGKLKETGTTHWNDPNKVEPNVTGFTALPGGSRDSGGSFSGIRKYSFWWSTTERFTDSAWCPRLIYITYDIGLISHSKEAGVSVRCVKD